MFQYETMDIFIAGEGNYYRSDKGGGLKRESLIGDATFLASGNFCTFGYIYDWPGVILYRGFVVEEFSTQLVSLSLIHI